MKRLFEEAIDMTDDEEEEEALELEVPIAPEELNDPPGFTGHIGENFNMGKSTEWRKAKYKWSLSERVLNAVIGRLNSDYSSWKDNLKWYQERNGRWNLYFINPYGMERYIQQIERDIQGYN